jgi:hypothetical protein
MNKVALSFVIIMGCLLVAPLIAGAENVIIKDGRMSADLKEASLAGIARDIEKQSGISFKGDDSLLEEKVSVSFKDLPLEAGIKRILANVNYSLIFNSQGEVSEIKIMSEGSGSAGSQPQIRSAPARTGTPSPAGRRPVVRRPGSPSPSVRSGSRAPVGQTPSGTARTSPQRPARPVPQTADESNLPEALKTMENAPAPGVSSEEPLPPAFRAIERAEPPAPEAKDTQETPDASKVRKRVPPPGGAAESSGEKPAEEDTPK